MRFVFRQKTGRRSWGSIFGLLDPEIYVLSAASLFLGDFTRATGRIILSNVGPGHLKRGPSLSEMVACHDKKYLVFELVRCEFMDALVYCLWQMNVQLEVRKLSIQTMVIDIDKRNERERLKIEALKTRQGLNIELFDFRPDRACRSKSLVVPRLPMMRRNE